VRKRYLDWLRGIAVLIMIEGHTIDSWTRSADRGGDGYRWAIIVAGFGAPIFLFLAGIALALAAGSRLRKGLPSAAVGAAALKRGLWIFALAFLFRLQSWAISGGSFPQSLLKVDILNVMGSSMIVAAVLWRAGRSDKARMVMFAAATILAAMLTPLIRETPSLEQLPDPIEWYLRPAAGSTTFTLFPWAGFLTAGAAIGILLDRARASTDERRLNIALALVGLAIAGGGYASSFLPAIYERSGFWTSSPTFFFLRLGVLIAAVPAAYAASVRWRGATLEEFGRASLFVYWIHVEMVYGVLSAPIHRRLPFAWALVALAVFSAALFGLVRLKARLIGRGRSPKGRISSKTAVAQATPGLP
jgi:uncharacterized membrane protein